MNTRKLRLPSHGNVVVHWCIGENAFSEMKRHKEMFDCGDSDEAKSSQCGQTHWNSSNFGVFIWQPTRGIIAHEVFHVVYHIMKHLEVTLCRESEEAFAYLTQHLTEVFYQGWKP